MTYPKHFTKAQRRAARQKAYRRRKDIQRVSHTWRGLGITWKWYEKKLKEQGGVCAICKRPPGEIQLHVDHDHSNGKPRGLLCGNCNMQLGWFEKRMGEVVDYLDKYDA